MKRRLTMTFKDEVTTYDPIDVPYNDYSRINFQNVLKKLAHYEDLVEQGRLIILPCKPFEKVWVAHPKFSIHQTTFCCNAHILETMEAGYVIGYTKEEAEAKLKELRGEQE